MDTRKLTSEKIADMREQIALDLGSIGEWRSRKQVEHPDDRRNSEASDILDALEKSVNDIPDQLIERYAALWQNDYPEDTDPLYELTNDWSERTRQIGFYSEPASAQEFVEEFVIEWEGKLAPSQTQEPKPRRRAIRQKDVL